MIAQSADCGCLALATAQVYDVNHKEVHGVAVVDTPHSRVKQLSIELTLTSLSASGRNIFFS